MIHKLCERIFVKIQWFLNKIFISFTEYGDVLGCWRGHWWVKTYKA